MRSRHLSAWPQLVGIDLRRLSSLRHIGRFCAQLYTYRREARRDRFPLRLSALYPVLSDLEGCAGDIRGHYFHQDLWAARKIFCARPSHHVDVGSRIDGFVAHLLTFMPVTVVDIRGLPQPVEGLTFVRSNAQNMSALATASVESLSCLHAVEHFGLGRYGDPVDPTAWFRSMRELARVLAPNGRLYLSVPVGVERVEFNAHRIFAPATILETFADLHLLAFAAVDDDGVFHPDATPADFAAADYSCGMFEFARR